MCRCKSLLLHNIVCPHSICKTKLWTGSHIACSRLSVVGDERKRARKKPHCFSRSPFFRSQLAKAWNRLDHIQVRLTRKKLTILDSYDTCVKQNSTLSFANFVLRSRGAVTVSFSVALAIP